MGKESMRDGINSPIDIALGGNFFGIMRVCFIKAAENLKSTMAIP